MRILITGSAGFIGSHLEAEAIRQGHEVIALSRRGNPAVRWALGEPLPPAAQRDIDCAIHLAHDFDGPDAARKTIEGTSALIEALRAAGVRRQLFFSSLSSRPDATSLYGTTKFEIERLVADQSDVKIVRPGLVLGDGGIYGRMKRWVGNCPLVPLPDGGRGPICVIGIDSLCRQTLRILAFNTKGREFNLFEPRPQSLRDLIESEAARLHRRILIIPIPSKLLLSALSIAEQLGLPMPVKADNLMGFLANRSEVHRMTPVETL